MGSQCNRDSAVIQLAIVDDETLVRECLFDQFRQIRDVHCAIASDDTNDALRQIEAARPDVVLHARTSKPDTDWRLQLRLWRERLPSVSLLLLDDRIRDQHVRMALRIGAGGYCTKRDCFSDIVRAIRQCAKREKAFTEEIRKRLFLTANGWTLHSAHDGPGLHILTDRETEVLTHLAQGLTVKQCSESLGISPSTVDNHRARIMKKLQVRKTVDLTRLAMREGLISG